MGVRASRTKGTGISSLFIFNDSRKIRSDGRDNEDERKPARNQQSTEQDLMFRRLRIHEAEKNKWRGSKRASRNSDPFGPNAIGEITDERAGESGDGKTHEDEAGVEGGPVEEVFDIEGEDAVEGGEDGDVDEDAVDGG